MKRSNTLYTYLAVMLGVVIFGVILVNTIGQVKEKSTDARARAATASSLQFTGVVSTLDAANATVTVEGLTMTSGSRLLPGRWTVTAAKPEDLSKLREGMKIRMAVSSQTLNLGGKTLTALEIR
jgi:hypothetical protein